MKRPFTVVFLGLSLLTAVFFISGCGDDVCVAGIGDCDIPENLQTQNGNDTPGVSSASVIVYAAQARVRFGNKVNVTALGGKAPHTFTIEGGGSFTNTKTVNETTTTEYTAPSQLEYTGVDETYVIITAKDANNRTRQMALIVSTTDGR